MTWLISSQNDHSMNSLMPSAEGTVENEDRADDMREKGHNAEVHQKNPYCLSLFMA